MTPVNYNNLSYNELNNINDRERAGDLLYECLQRNLPFSTCTSQGLNASGRIHILLTMHAYIFDETTSENPIDTRLIQPLQKMSMDATPPVAPSAKVLNIARLNTAMTTETIEK